MGGFFSCFYVTLLWQPNRTCFFFFDDHKQQQHKKIKILFFFNSYVVALASPPTRVLLAAVLNPRALTHAHLSPPLTRRCALLIPVPPLPLSSRHQGKQHTVAIETAGEESSHTDASREKKERGPYMGISCLVLRPLAEAAS